METSGIQWRFTAHKVRILGFDAMVVMPPLVLFAMHIRVWTAIVLAVVVLGMWMVELFFQMPLSVARRSLRSFVAGRHRPVVPWWKERRL